MTTSNPVRASSDHKHISAVLRTKDRLEQAHESTRRDRKGMDLERYRLRIKNLDWTDFYKSSDINMLNDMFVDKVGGILDDEAPLRNFQARRNHVNWLTSEMKYEMERRNVSRELARRTGGRFPLEGLQKDQEQMYKKITKVENRVMFKGFEKENDTKKYTQNH